ncbi:MAG: hypothetical protein FWD71_09820 [Oscillospiraceae bacterium]|nr:hypothetical protein [Oscillospiraceae bacterium]
MTSETLPNNKNININNNRNGFFNLGLLINNLKQNKFILIMTAIIMFIASPLIEFLAVLFSTTSGELLDINSMKSMAQALSVSVNLATAVLAVILGFNIMGYMHNRKAAIFYNSIPIKRTELFFTQIVTGLIYFIPALVLSYILSAAFLPYAETFKVISQNYGAALLLYIIAYSFAVFCANIGGTFLNSLFAMAYLSAIIPAVYGVCTVFIQSIFKFTDVYAGFTDTTFHIITMPVTYYVTVIFSRTTKIYDVIFMLIISVLFIAGAWLLNRFTKTENAEKTFYFNKFQAFFKYSILIIISVAGGLFFKSGITDNLLFILLGIIVIGFIAFLVINFIIFKNIREVFKGIKSFAIMLVVVCVFSGIFQNDIFGIDKRLPNAADVESVSYIRFVGSDYNWNTGLGSSEIPALYNDEKYSGPDNITFTDPETIQLANDVFNTAFKSVRNTTDYGSHLTYSYFLGNVNTTPFQGNDPINYNLKNGGKISKKLPPAVFFSNGQDLQNYEDALNKLQSSIGYTKAYYLPLTDENIMNKFIDFPNTNYNITIDDVEYKTGYGDVQASSTTLAAQFISKDELLKIIDCLNQDISSTVDLSVQTDFQHMLSITFKTTNYSDTTFNIGLTAQFVNTLNYLNDNYLNQK